jgi:hypothetical protein
MFLLQIEGKKFKQLAACCKKKCTDAFSLEDQERLFKGFWDIGDKAQQDTLLLGFLHPKELKTKKTDVKTKNREHGWTYSLQGMKGDECNVCRSFVLKLLQISEKRLRHVQNEVMLGNLVMQERRGLHNNRPHKIPN